MFEFLDTPKEERAAWAARARGGASIPLCYLSDLDRAQATGKLERIVDEICVAEPVHATGPGDTSAQVLLTFNSQRAPMLVDRIVLATGAILDVDRVPLYDVW